MIESVIRCPNNMVMAFDKGHLLLPGVTPSGERCIYPTAINSNLVLFTPIRLIRRTKMIKSVIRCPNDMVIVFDKDGEQIPQYQGQYEEVRESILKNAPLNTVFAYLSDFEPELRKVPREGW